jgi:CBS domain containing-hemolysin-like protein
VNDSVVIHDLELTVKSADERRAKEVLVRPINSQESPADQA